MLVMLRLLFLLTLSTVLWLGVNGKHYVFDKMPLREDDGVAPGTTDEESRLASITSGDRDTSSSTHKASGGKSTSAFVKDKYFSSDRFLYGFDLIEILRTGSLGPDSDKDTLEH